MRANTDGSPKGANKVRLDFAKKHLKKARPLLEKYSLDAGIKINLHQNDRKKKVWRRHGTAHDPKHTTSSVKHGHAWLPVALGYWCLLMT